MAKFQDMFATEIQNAMYRPCFVDGKKALFHRWTAYNVIDYAIVEYEDGTVDIVHPQSIRFVSGKFKEYSFDERKGAKQINIMLDSEALMPKRGHATDAGLDLLSPLDTVVPAKGCTSIDTGVHIELPPNTAGFLKSKSGLNVKYGITSEGVIDVGYNGSIVCKLYNHSNMDYEIKRGDKITQLVVMKIDIPELNVVDEFKATERGNNGFGSTGR